MYCLVNYISGSQSKGKRKVCKTELHMEYRQRIVNFLLDSLFPLGFPHFRLHVPLGHDITEGCAYNRTLVLLCPPGALLGLLFLLPFLELTPINN